MGSAKNYGDKTARQLRLILPRKSAFAALRSDKPPSKLKCEQRLRFCKADKRGSIPLYVIQLRFTTP